MNIIEATKKALETNGMISRAPFIGYAFFDLSDYVVMFYSKDDKTTRHWNPTTDDLLCEEWEVVTDPESNP